MRLRRENDLAQLTRRAWIPALTGLILAGASADAQTALKRYESRYYIIFTDVDRDSVREALARIDRMAEEYNSRTRGFAGEIRDKLPFYLFRQVDDYIAAGGMPGSAGVFTGDKLMGVMGEKNSDFTWHVVQHEGFHQFVHAVIGGDIPTWANEGMAEYFGEAVFSGDGFVSGMIPGKRLARIKQGIREKRFKPLREMMLLKREVWNAEMSGPNYDQAWSMIQFLAAAEGGKYAKSFNAFLREVSRGEAWEAAWTKHLGRDVKAFEDKWRDYWLSLPDDPTAELYARATVATLTSYLARAYTQKQYFDSADDFLAAAKDGTLKAHKDDWLPASLLENALRDARSLGEWSLARGSGGSRLTATLSDGTKLSGSFKTRGGRVTDVDVESKKTKTR